MSCFTNAIRFLWGDLSRDEYKKFGILAATMMLIIGNYWMLRVTKDALFNLFVGYKTYGPIIKMVSPLVMLIAVLFYSKLVDIFKRSTLIYIMCTFYGFAFIILGLFISQPDLVAISQTSVLYPLASWIPGKGIGWVAYLLLESYGSLLIGLFYAFIASIMSADLAKRGYGFMFIFIQLATMLGIIVEMYIVKSVGFSTVYLIGGVLVLIAPFFIKLYLSIFAQEVAAMHNAHKTKKQTGFFEGARLILTNPYVMGLFVVASFYEIIHFIIEYQMGITALSVLSTQEFAVFKGYQGLGINVLSFTFAFIGGTSIFMRKFGLKFCLITFPITIGFVVVACYLSYAFGMSDAYLMWVLLGASVAIRGLNYSLNKPTSEVMYIPTSKDVKFKSKGWVDMFGVRVTKSAGGWITWISPLLLFGTIASLGVIAIWIAFAAFVGDKFNQLQKENKIIE